MAHESRVPPSLSLCLLLALSACASGGADQPWMDASADEDASERRPDVVMAQRRHGDVGEPCAGHADCEDGLCVEIGGGDSACSEPCDEGADCVAGWECGRLGDGELSVPACLCTAGEEVCNAADDDCDGVIDEGCAPDAGVDGGDGGLGVLIPVEREGGVDGETVGGSDSGFDAGRDAGDDAGTDSGFDAGYDSGRDAGFDAGRDAGYDSGRDAGFDAGFDAGRDAGYDAGPPAPACSLGSPVSIAVGTFHMCLADAAGRLCCAGDMPSEDPHSNRLQQVHLAADGSDLAAINQHSGARFMHCARRSDASILCWGLHSSGSLGIGTDSSPPYAPQAVHVRSPGGGNLTAAQVHASHSGACARRGVDGAVFCWGQNNQGQVGDMTTATRTSAVAVKTSAGDALTGTSAICAGLFGGCALMPSGEVWCWGSNLFGALGTGAPYQNSRGASPVLMAEGGAPLGGAVEVTCGANHACARRSDGTILCWGGENDSAVGDGTPGMRRMPVRVLRSPGGSPVNDAVRIVAHDYTTCYLTAAGAPQCWGLNHDGALGDGTTTSRSTPVAPRVSAGGPAFAGVANIAPGSYNTCAIKTDGSVWCWGSNTDGLFGNGTTTSSLYPTRVPTPTMP